MHTYIDWQSFRQLQALTMYMNITNNVIMAQSPCFLLFPFLISLCPLLIPFYLLGTLLAVIGSRPPWSQVARKLISPFPSPPHSLPFPKSRPLGFPELNMHLTKMTSRIWLTSPEQEGRKGWYLWLTTAA
jgi:hypothetical protein